MTDIKDYVPDTSKYTDPADRWIALGLVMKSGKCIEYRGPGLQEWKATGAPVDSLPRAVFAGFDYRAKPEPRVVRVVFDKDGDIHLTYDIAPDVIRQGYSCVRFVESAP